MDPGKLAHATLLGTDLASDVRTESAIDAIVHATEGGAHGALINAPSLSAFRQGVAMTRKRGTCVLVELPPSYFLVSLFDVVMNASRFAAHSSALVETWQKRWHSPPEVWLSLMSNCSRYRRSTRCSIVSIMAPSDRAWLSTLLQAPRRCKSKQS